MEFNSFQKEYFEAINGAFSKVTEREHFDSQITLTDIEAELVIEYFGNKDIQVGNVSGNVDLSKKEFLLYPNFKSIFLNVVYPKVNKRELRLYLSATKGFKPLANDIWFIYKNKQNQLVVGALTETEWNNIQLDDIASPEKPKTGLKIFNITNDLVIKGKVSLGEANYRYALDHIYPLIDRFEAQRRMLDNKFYDRLERDILKGCLMPPITLAFVDGKTPILTIQDMQEYIMENMNFGYVLDGIQRLNTLFRASKHSNFDDNKPIFLNVIISDNKDKLLYRMITLNNGQKSMTPRHQIEMLTQELFDFEELTNIKFQTEKEKSDKPVHGAFSYGDISKGYIAFLTDNVHNENSKIIEEKMDQILVGRLLDTNLESFNIQFFDVIQLIDDVCSNKIVQEWLQVSNNLIGFCAGIKSSFNFIESTPLEDIQRAFETFDKAFKAVNPSKVNVGKYRRELSSIFIKNADETFLMNEDDLIERFSEITS
ncbi:MAG: hypothetical protein JWN56_517 [Sphingobacteriales bacterium]|nr:hypothetical protein [Sphingobacteriales bacterium]